MAAVLLDREVPAPQLVGEMAGDVEDPADGDQRQADESEPGEVAQRVHAPKYN